MKKIADFFKKKRTYFKGISMILVLALMIQTVSIAVTAISESGLSIDEMVSIKEEFSVDNSLETMPSIVGEVESKRDRYTKVYELADGSFYEIISSEPIHKNVDGQWEEPENNMNMPESVNEATSYCNELVESISEELNDGDVSTFSLIVDEGISHSLNGNYYVIGRSGSVVTNNQVNKYNRLFVRIPDCLLSFSNTNQITLNQSINVEFTVNKTGVTGLMYAYGILEDWKISDAQTLTAYRFDEETQNYSYSTEVPNNISRQTTVMDNFSFTKDDNIGCLDITELCVKWSKKLLDNNGIIIIPDNGSTATIGNCCLTRRYLVVDAYDTDFTYHSIDMGKAGQVLVNDFTNTITILRNEMYYPTGKMPINLYRYFDFSKTYSDSNPSGIGTHWNYESPITVEDVDRIAWSAFDGRTIRFKPSETDSTKWYPENTKEYELNLNGSNITTAEYDGVTISSSDGLTYTFGMAGKITRIDDGNNNYIEVSYNNETTQNYIIGIENNSGYRYEFTYETILNDAEEINSLSKISYQSKINNETETYETICINDTPIEMSYEYIVLSDDIIALSKVTYPRDSVTPKSEQLTVEYLYDNGRLVGIVDIDKRKLEINYTKEITDSGVMREIDNYPSAFMLTEKVLNREYSSNVEGSNEYLEKSSLNINRLFTYRREFEDHLGNVETIHYNRDLKLLYYNNDSGDSYYVEYATSDDKQYVSQILSPQEIISESDSKLINGDFERDENLEENYWFSDIYESLSIEEGSLDGTGHKLAKFNGFVGVEQYISKYADIEGAEGDVIVVGSHARAESAVPTEAHFFGIEIYKATRVSGGDPETTDELLYRLAFDPTMDNEVQYRMGAFELTDDIACVEIRLVYSYQNGSAEFDNALIYKTRDENVTFFDSPISDNIIPDDSSSSSNENDDDDILSDGVNQMGTLYDYSDGTNNYLMGITDSNDVTTRFSYDDYTGFLIEKHVDMGDDSTDIIDQYSYNALGALTAVSRVVGHIQKENGEDEDICNTTRYEYKYGKISSVVHNNMTYKFNYNSYGELEDIVVVADKEDDIILISHDSTTIEDGTFNTITYSNGYVLEYTYDDGKITSISERSTPSSDLNLLYSYEYDDVSGDLETIKDYVSCRIIKYSVDSFEVHELVKNDGNESEGELLYSKSIDNGDEVYNVFSVGYTKTSNNSTYNNESKITTYSSSTTTNIGNPVKFDSYSAYDYFGRIKNSSVIISEQDVQNNEDYTIKHSIENESTYLNNADGTLTTNLLGSYSSTIRSGPVGTGTVLNEFTSEYSYDRAGRITHIYYKQNNNNKELKYYYKYDIVGQLVKEADFLKQTYTEYSYDINGNITRKTVYSILDTTVDSNGEYMIQVDDEGNLPASLTDIEYTYHNKYGDVLKEYGGYEIVTDEYGNPDKYYRINGDEKETFLLEWKGKQLHTVKSANDDSVYEYKYDDEGRRTQKILYTYYESETSENNIVDMIMDYIWDDNKIMGYRITFPSDTTIMIDAAIIYDELDDPIGLNFRINGIAAGENNSDLSNEDIFWFVKDGQGNVIAIYSEKSNYTIGCNYTLDGKLEISDLNSFTDELNQKIEEADDFQSGLLMVLSAILAIRASTMLSTDASQATYISAIMDEETGLYYCQNRYYSPEYGRYINAGNVEEIASDMYNPFDANPFVYYNNDPVNCKGTASSKKPATKVVGIQAELSKSLTSFTDSMGIELIYDSVKDELYAYYYQDTNSYSNYNGVPRAIEMITDIFENVSFSSNISLKNLALVLKMNNCVSLSYFNAETNKRFIWPASYLGTAKVKPNDNNRYTVYGSGYQSKGICYYPVSNLGFGTKDMSVRYRKIEWESEHLKGYLLANKDNIIEAVK